MKRRSKLMMLTFVGLFTALALRLMYFQMAAGETLYKAASAQRVKVYPIEKPRGEILDRNMIPFTNRSKKHTVVLKPLMLRENPDGLDQVCSLLGQDYSNIKGMIETKRDPIFFDIDANQKDEILSLNLKGISIVNSLKRYEENTLAKHVIGYLNRIDQLGETGIEKYFENVLQYDRENNVGVVIDAKNNLVSGLGYRMIRQEGKEEKLNVRLTLDYHIQKIVEDVMEKHGVTGAVVVEDVNTGDILAMASKPDYDQMAVERYLNSAGNELFNRATAAYNLGSVFKIVDVALLLEKGIDPEEKFFCPGYIKVGNREFKCSSFDKGGHGWVDMRQAFAYSCNPYFIQKGIEIGYRDLIRMAQNFGLGTAVGLKDQGVAESSGNLPDIDSHYSSGDIANLSIGQGALLATPLQVADMIATVANGGIRNKVNITDAIVDEDGNKVRSIKVKDGKRIISKPIADSIRGLMEEVTAYGTGTRANLEGYGGAAGKTGSAETGQSGIVHAWFAGYFPQKDPRYSVAVFIENGQYGGATAAPIFAEIAIEIMSKGF